MEKDRATSACAYRRVERGRTFCTRATDEFDREVWPEVCARCPVPAWLAAGICTHLDIGTEVARKVDGEAGPRVFTACRFFRERLDGLERCRSCPHFSPWQGEESEAEEGGSEDTSAEGEQSPEESQAAAEPLRMMPACFRAGVAQCLRFPELVPDRVLVLPPPSIRPAEPYRALVEQILKQGGLQALFFVGPLRDVDGLCDLCLAVQQCPRLIVDVSEWDAGALFAMGLGRALGRGLLLIRGQDSTPPFIPQGLPVHEYSSGEELAMLLVRGLGISLQPARGEVAAGEKVLEDKPAEAPEEQPAAAPGPAEQPPPPAGEGSGEVPSPKPRKSRSKKDK